MLSGINWNISTLRLLSRITANWNEEYPTVQTNHLTPRLNDIYSHGEAVNLWQQINIHEGGEKYSCDDQYIVPWTCKDFHDVQNKSFHVKQTLI